MSRKTVGALLFEGFELLDVFGPLEAWGMLAKSGTWRVITMAEKAGSVASAQGPRAVADYALTDCPKLDVIVVPGGIGTRREANNARVHWVRQARWVEDGRFFTSAGVSAGIDMTLAVIARLTTVEVAERIAIGMEYDWHRDPSWDPFAKVHRLV